MRWMIWPRQYGKSYEIEKWWMEDPKNRGILTSNENLARIRRRDLEEKMLNSSRVFEKEVRQLVKQRVLSVRSFQNSREAFPTGTEVAADDVAAILHILLGPGVDIKVCASVGKNSEPDLEQKRDVDRHWDEIKHMIPKEVWEHEGR